MKGIQPVERFIQALLWLLLLIKMLTKNDLCVFVYERVP